MNSICHQKQFKLSRLFTMCFAAAVAIGVTTPSMGATLGHSRLVSGIGQALRIHIPIKQITPNELTSLSVSPAPQQQWQQSGLTPPVDLSSISVGLIDGATAGSHVLVVSSQQIFDKPIADLLLDIKTDSGTQIYQVSILAQNDATVIQTPMAAPVSINQAASGISSDRSRSESSQVAGKTIQVKPGDTMFAIANRNAIANISVYQMMIALQRANPSAFINENVNLVKAGATLTMPDSAALNAISDSQARKIFHQQVLAFKQGFNVNNADSGDLVNDSDNVVQTQNDTESASIENQLPENNHNQPPENNHNQLPENNQNQVENNSDTKKQATESTTDGLVSGADELKLSAMINGAAQGIANSVSGTALAAENSDADADDKLANEKAVEYTKEKISQLEENVKNLNKALTAQGSAASDAVIESALEIQKAISEEVDSVSDAISDLIADDKSDAVDASALDSKVSETQTSDTAVSDTAVSDTAVSDDTALQSSTADTTATENAAADTTSSSVSPGVASSTDVSASKHLIAPTNKPKAWFKTYFLALAGGLIAFIVLIIVWVLRRSYITDTSSSASITPEMVQEKLSQINLNLNEPSIKDDNKKM